MGINAVLQGGMLVFFLVASSLGQVPASGPGNSGKNTDSRPSDNPVVASVNGKVFTLNDVDRIVSRQLQDLEERRYTLRRAAVEQAINHILLEKAAKAQGTSIPSLIEASVKEVTDLDVSDAYDRVKDQSPDALNYTVMQQIRESLQKEARQNAYRDTIRLLRSQADISVVLDRPKIEIGLFQSIAGPSLGPDNADVKLVVFFDYNCGYCRRSTETLQALKEQYGDKIQIVYKFLVPNDNSPSTLMAKSALCADRQHLFDKYHVALLGDEAIKSTEQLSALAARVGLDQKGFDACTASEEVNMSIDRDRKDAGLSGARATPFFLLNAQMFRGIQPFEEFVRVIDHQLGDTKPADLRGEVRISGGIQRAK